MWNLFTEILYRLRFAQKWGMWPIWLPHSFNVLWLCDCSCYSLQRVEVGIVSLLREVLSKSSQTAGFISRQLQTLRDFWASGTIGSLLFSKVEMYFSFLAKNELWHSVQVCSFEKEDIKSWLFENGSYLAYRYIFMGES